MHEYNNLGTHPVAVHDRMQAVGDCEDGGAGELRLESCLIKKEITQNTGEHTVRKR